jgi:hypothetical protein
MNIEIPDQGCIQQIESVDTDSVSFEEVKEVAGRPHHRQLLLYVYKRFGKPVPLSSEPKVPGPGSVRNKLQHRAWLMFCLKWNLRFRLTRQLRQRQKGRIKWYFENYLPGVPRPRTKEVIGLDKMSEEERDELFEAFKFFEDNTDAGVESEYDHMVPVSKFTKVLAGERMTIEEAYHAGFSLWNIQPISWRKNCAKRNTMLYICYYEIETNKCKSLSQSLACIVYFVCHLTLYCYFLNT